MKTLPLVLLAGSVLLASGALAAAAGSSPSVARETTRPFAFQLPRPARLSVPVLSANAPVSQEAAEPVRLAAIEVKGRPDMTLRDLNNAVAWEKMNLPCDLFIGPNGGSVQVRALGAPVPPLAAEASQPGQRANFPLVTLAW
jgi:hypothetical protein